MNTELSNKIQNISNKIRNSKNPLLVFDVDSDGSMSAVILIKTFHHIKRLYALNKDDDSQQNLHDIISDEFDLIIFFDTPYVKKNIFEKANGASIIWVDHHPDEIMTKYSKEFKNITILNPLLFDKNDSRSSSYWAYHISGNKELLFYMIIGSLGDFYLLDDIKELYFQNKTYFNLLFKKLTDEKREELFKFLNTTPFNSKEKINEITNWILTLWYETDFIRFKMFFDELYKIEKQEISIRTLKKISKFDPIEFASEFNASKLHAFYEFEKIEKEFREHIKKAIEQNKKSKQLVLYHHKDASISFNRQISEELRFLMPESELVIASYEKSDKDLISLSLRSKSINIPLMLKSTLKGLNGRGGGHPHSGGCSIEKKDFDKLKENIKTYLKTNLN